MLSLPSADLKIQSQHGRAPSPSHALCHLTIAVWVIGRCSSVALCCCLASLRVGLKWGDRRRAMSALPPADVGEPPRRAAVEPHLLVVVLWGPGEQYSLFGFRCWVYKCHVLLTHISG